jgi:hypothetical protein
MNINTPKGARVEVETDALSLEELVSLEARLANHAHGYWKASQLVHRAIDQRGAKPGPAQLPLQFESES